MFEKNKPTALTQKSSSKTEKFVNLIFFTITYFTIIHSMITTYYNTE